MYLTYLNILNFIVIIFKVFNILIIKQQRTFLILYSKEKLLGVFSSMKIKFLTSILLVITKNL